MKRFLLAMSLACALGPTTAEAANPPKPDPDAVIEALERRGDALLDLIDRAAERREKKRLTEGFEASAKGAPPVLKLEDRPFAGKSGAKTSVVIFTDFFCHYCREADGMLAGYLKDSPDASVHFKMLPLAGGDRGREAAALFHGAWALDHEKALAFARLLFERQDQLRDDRNVRALTDDLLRKAGLDVERTRWMAASPDIRKRLDEDIAEGRALGIQGTPCMFVNGIRVEGALPRDVFEIAVGVAKKKLISGADAYGKNHGR